MTTGSVSGSISIYDSIRHVVIRHVDPIPLASQAKRSTRQSSAMPASVEPLQKQVRGEIHGQRDNNEVSKKIRPAGNRVLLMKVEAPGPVDIRVRPPEKIHGDHHPGHH